MKVEKIVPSSGITLPSGTGWGELWWQHYRARRKVCLSLAVLSCLTSKAQQLPNIVYIMSDDHAYQAISAYDDPIGRLAPTPNIDRIARQGMRFDNAFVENSLSTPSRACLITGMYSHQNGQLQLEEGIDTTLTYFPELLQQAGYQTGFVGKWHLCGTPKGFDSYHMLFNQGEYYNPVFRSHDSNGEFVREEGYATELITQHAKDFLENRDKQKPFCLMIHHKAPHRNWVPAEKYLGMYDSITFPLPSTFYDDYATRGSAAHTQKMSVEKDLTMLSDLKIDMVKDRPYKVSRFIGRLNQDQTESLMNYYMRRNDKFHENPPQGHQLAQWKYQAYLRDYLSVIHSVDESVGEILDYLEANGLTENTIVVYTSDQGFYLGEHGWFDKRFMYEQSLRTPLLIMYPKAIKAGTVCQQMVQNIDYAPTFLSLAGIEKPAYMSGRSLEPLFDGKEVKQWRTSIYYHYYDYPTWHLVRKHDGVRTERYKLIHFYGKGGERARDENQYQNVPGTREYNSYVYMKNDGYFTDDPDVDYMELYDLQTDPDELNNLYGKKGYEKVTARLTKLLKKYRKDLNISD